MENEQEEEVTQNVPIVYQSPLATESQRPQRVRKRPAWMTNYKVYGFGLLATASRSDTPSRAAGCVPLGTIGVVIDSKMQITLELHHNLKRASKCDKGSRRHKARTA